jgi:hypothetical protein
MIIVNDLARYVFEHNVENNQLVIWILLLKGGVYYFELLWALQSFNIRVNPFDDICCKKC